MNWIIDQCRRRCCFWWFPWGRHPPSLGVEYLDLLRSKNEDDEYDDDDVYYDIMASMEAQMHRDNRMMEIRMV